MKSPKKKSKSTYTHYTKKREEGLQLLDHENRKYNRTNFFTNKRKRNYPVLIVENLPPDFGNIDKSNRKRALKFSKEEENLLNLIARIAVEIFIKEEL